MKYSKVFTGLFTLVFFISVFFSFYANAENSTNSVQSENPEEYSTEEYIPVTKTAEQTDGFTENTEETPEVTETTENPSVENETTENTTEEPETVSASGDMDSDGLITSSDARSILIFSLGIEKPTREDIDKADTDRDGEVTLKDAVFVLRVSAGFEAPVKHKFTPWKTDVEATCKNNGMEISICTLCGLTKTKITPKTRHFAGFCATCGKDFISYTSEEKEIVFGDSAESVTEIYGEPSETLKNRGCTIFIYELYEKAKLEIFFFDKNGLCEIYSTDVTAYFSDGEKNIVFNNNDAFTEKGVTYYFFEDSQSQKHNKIYAVRALLNGTDASTFNKSDNNKVFEKILLYLTNLCRAMNEVEKLEYNDEVAEVALKHSEDMAERNFYSHENPEGKKVYDRIVEAGLSKYGCYGENICAATLNVFNASDGWYNSTKGHRENILNTNFKYMGAGFAYNGSSVYKYYGTQVFFTPY